MGQRYPIKLIDDAYRDEKPPKTLKINKNANRELYIQMNTMEELMFFRRTFEE
jgi:hypothetical protein